jgi:hypothetical protein
MCQPAGVPVRRMPQRPSRSMSPEGRDDEAAGLRPGGIMSSPIALGQPPAARGGLGADGQRSQPPPPTESGDRLAVEVAALRHSEEDHGWTVLATTVSAETGADAAILQVSQEQNPTVDPGWRWIKNPAAMSPVWLEKPERIAAFAMRTVLGWLVSSIIQRQVRLSLRMYAPQLPGNKGLTATPTAAVVVALFTQVARVQ